MRQENAKCTIQALEEFGYDLTDTNSDDFLNNKILIRQYLVETDIHPFVKGILFQEGFVRIITNQDAKSTKHKEQIK